MFDQIINEGRPDLVEELFDPDFTSETPQGTLDREGFKQYVADWRNGFPTFTARSVIWSRKGRPSPGRYERPARTPASS